MANAADSCVPPFVIAPPKRNAYYRSRLQPSPLRCQSTSEPLHPIVQLLMHFYLLEHCCLLGFPNGAQAITYASKS